MELTQGETSRASGCQTHSKTDAFDICTYNRLLFPALVTPNAHKKGRNAVVGVRWMSTWDASAQKLFSKTLVIHVRALSDHQPCTSVSADNVEDIGNTYVPFQRRDECQRAFRTVRSEHRSLSQPRSYPRPHSSGKPSSLLPIDTTPNTANKALRSPCRSS